MFAFLSRQQRHEEIEGVFADAWRLAGDDPEVQSLVQVRLGRYWFNRWLGGMRQASGAEAPTEEERAGMQETYDRDTEPALDPSSQTRQENIR